MLLPFIFNSIFPPPATRVRLLHAAPDAGPVDVYVNDKLAYKNFAYTNSSPFIQLPVGKYYLTIYPTGQKATPLLAQHVGVVKWPWLTIALVGKVSALSLVQIPGSASNRTTSSVRFVHLAPDLPSVDLHLTGHTRLFSNATFKEISYYVPVFPGHYSFTVNRSGSAEPLLTSNIKVTNNKCYTIYLLGTNDELKAIVSQ